MGDWYSRFPLPTFGDGNDHSQFSGDWYSRKKNIFLTLLPYYQQQINTGPEVILCLKFKQDSLSLFILNEMRISTKVFNLIVTFVFTMQVKNQKKIDYFR